MRLRDACVVVIANVALFAPAATLTPDGTAATVVFELASLNVMPFAPAGALSVTVPLVAVPPTTLALASVNCASCGAAAGVSVSVVVFVAPPYDTLIVVAVCSLTGDVVIANGACVAPAATVTLAGT